MTTDDHDIYSTQTGTDGSPGSDGLPVSGIEADSASPSPDEQMEEPGTTEPGKPMEKTDGEPDEYEDCDDTDTPATFSTDSMIVKEAAPEDRVPIPPSEETPSNAEDSEVSDTSTGAEGKKVDQKIDANGTESFYLAGGHIYNNFYGAEKKKHEDEEESFTDPTQTISYDSTELCAFHSPVDWNNNMEKWQKERLLLVSCINEQISLSTAFQLKDLTQYNDYQKLQLSSDDLNSLRIGLKLETLVKHRIGRGEKVIILIDIEEGGEFYDSILNKSLLSANSIKENLARKDILLIAIVNNQLLARDVQQKEKEKEEEKKKQEDKKNESKFKFPLWEINFLPHLLKNYFRDDADVLVKRILEQRKQDLWGDQNDDYEFHDNIYCQLKKGIESFTAVLAEREKYMDSGNKPLELMEKNWENRIQAIFKDQEPHKTVMYVGAFFSKLPPLDFDKIVQLLLGEKTVKIISDGNDEKAEKTSEEKKAVDIWTESADNILKDCMLKAVTDGSSAQFIRFTQSYLENDLKKYFRESYPIYMRQQFHPIQESSILFSADVSPNISNNIVRLAAQMAILNPIYYGTDWLIGFIRQLNAKFDLKDTVSTSLDAAVFRYIENKANKMIRRHFYAQISKLIREMINHRQLEVVVKNFLNHLFTIDAHDAVLHIVLNVGKRMFPARRSEFDMFYWLKRLLDQGPANVKKDTYESLHQVAIKNQYDIYIVMESILEWVPDFDKPEVNLSPSNKFALFFIIHYCYGTLLRMREKHYGRWPSNYPLFRPLCKDYDDSQLEKLEKIIQWLLHPHTQKITAESNVVAGPGDRDGTKFDLYTYLAEILEEWSLILMGWDFDSGKPEAVALFHNIFRYIISGTDSSQHRKIFKAFAWNRNKYKNQFTQSNFIDKEKKQKLIIRYKILHVLIEKCKELMTNSVSSNTI